MTSEMPPLFHQKQLFTAPLVHYEGKCRAAACFLLSSFALPQAYGGGSAQLCNLTILLAQCQG